MQLCRQRAAYSASLLSQRRSAEPFAVQKHFALIRPARTPQQQQEYQQQLLQHVPEDQRAALTSDMLAAALGADMVENVPLLANTKEAAFVGINLYCAGALPACLEQNAAICNDAHSA